MTTVIARYDSVGEAESARSALDAAGVEVAIADENTIAIYWLYANAVGGIKLIVRDEDREEAAAILRESASDPTAVDDDLTESDAASEAAEVRAAPPEATCPSCGSSDVRPIPRLMIFFVIALLGTGLAAAVEFPELAPPCIAAAALATLTAPTRRCGACAERWIDADPRNVEEKATLPVAAVDDVRCPRCGSDEYYAVDFRRVKALPLLFAPSAFIVIPVWLLLPKRTCDACGLRG